MSNYTLGTMVRLNGSFRTVYGALDDPATVTFEIQVPSGTITTYTYGVDNELVRESEGNYYVDWTTADSGTYTYRFASVGTVTAANENTFTVPSSPFA
jgi:hypothetical protein